jgi:hypothetical protein
MNALMPQPPTANVADFAQAMALGAASRQATDNRAAIVFGAQTTPVAPANVSAPTSFLIAAIALTPKVSGRFQYDFTLIYTDSAADTVTGVIGIVSPYTSVSGGTLLNKVYWESSPITISGGTILAAPGTYAATFGAGNLQQTMVMGGLSPTAPLGVPLLIILEVTAVHNLSAMSLVCSAFELP